MLVLSLAVFAVSVFEFRATNLFEATSIGEAEVSLRMEKIMM